jgi:hypothetical protein
MLKIPAKSLADVFGDTKEDILIIKSLNLGIDPVELKKKYQLNIPDQQKPIRVLPYRIVSPRMLGSNGNGAQLRPGV